MRESGRDDRINDPGGNVKVVLPLKRWLHSTA